MATHDRRKIKVVIIGETDVGKSSMATRFATNTFTKEKNVTIGGAYIEAKKSYFGLDIDFIIHDTAGQERFFAIAPIFFRDTEAAIIVYDITSMEKFRGVRRWYNQLMQYAGPTPVVVLCGNKCDLDSQRCVLSTEGVAMAKNFGISFFETSALSGFGIEEVFREITFLLFGDQCQRISIPATHVPEIVKPETPKHTDRKKTFIEKIKCM